LDQSLQTPEQQACFHKFNGYDFWIEYKPGKDNVAADALSRVFVEASFMMMNQVDSSSFDDNKDDDKKAQENDFKNKIQESREVWFQDSREDEFKVQEKKSRILHKGSIEKIFQKTNIAQFCFSKEFSQNFLSYQSFYSLVIDYQFPVIDY